MSCVRRFHAVLSEAVSSEAVERGGSVVLDLSGVEFLDSGGLHVLMRTNADAERAGGALLVVPSPAVTRILEVTRLSEGTFALHRDRAAALAAAGAGADRVPGPSPS
jgi:anti-anti-sigma factor